MGSLATSGADPGSSIALRIGEWEVRPASNEIARGGQATHLEAKVMEVLTVLAGRAGEVVTRDELLAAAWPGVVVGDEAVSQAINKLRRSLGDEAQNPRYIETIAKRGYRLIAPVSRGALAVAPKRGAKRIALAITIVVALLVAGAFLALTHHEAGGSRRDAASPPTIAVLPLANLSGDPKRDYLSDGVTEDIINSLGRFSAVRVISRSSVERFRAQPTGTAAIRRELNAAYVLTGSVREAGGKVRVAVQLSDAERGTVLWSERYEGEAKALFAIQDEIVRSIVAALEVKVTRLELTRAATKAPENLEAYDLTLRARALAISPDRTANRQARELLARAQRMAPDYAEAWVVSSNAEILRSLFGWTETPAESLRIAESHARRALALDDPGALSRAHGLLGVIFSIQGRFEEALTEADLAIALNPSDSFAHDTRGATLLWLGRFDEAIASLESAFRYNPAVRSAASGFNRALAHYMLDRPQQGLAAADETLASYPKAPFLHAIRAASLAQLGRMEEARAASETARRLDPFFQVEEFGTRFVKRDHYAAVQSGLRRAGF